MTDDQMPTVEEIAADLDAAIEAAINLGHLPLNTSTTDVLYVMLALYLGFVAENLGVEQSLVLLNTMFEDTGMVLVGRQRLITPE